MKDLLAIARQVAGRQSGVTLTKETKETKEGGRPPPDRGLISFNSFLSYADLPVTPCPDDALAWRRAYFAECDRLMIRDGIVLAQPKAFERVLHEWHQRHAWPASEWCAGCGGDLAGGQSIHEFPTGESVHLTDDLACWLEFGRRWRAAAVAGLADLGIEAPAGWEPELV
jgi:hypothetical protein